MAGEEEKAVSALEEAFGRIKEATGITDVQVKMLKLLYIHIFNGCI